tara:strand:+ start:5605 stop:6285 length:681 start_codon:yes stop_codon:yes gene_type:complete
MNTYPTKLRVALLIATPLIFLSERAMAQDDSEANPSQTEAQAPIDSLMAVLQPTKDSPVRGAVYFHQAEAGVKVTGMVEGLIPNSEHGFHIHQYADTSAPDGSTVGGHFNPQGHDHGLPGQVMRHAGDLGNLKADSEGVARIDKLVANITLTDYNAIIGRSVVVHHRADTGAQPSGEAGSRAAVGVIGVSPPSSKLDQAGDKLEKAAEKIGEKISDAVQELKDKLE